MPALLSKTFLRLAPVLAILPALVTGARAAETDDLYDLVIRPSICVSYSSDTPCAMMLHISWHGGSTRPVCLKTAMDDFYIQCWNNEVSGSIELAWENDSNVVYQLVSMQNNRVLAEREVQVISRDLRESRRRRRHVWSIL